MTNYTSNLNLYKWDKSDKKLDTITETASTMDKIDTALNNATNTANIAKTTADSATTTANNAVTTANTATTTANDAKTTANSVQSQFNQVVAEAGSNNPEVVNARGTFPLLKNRLDDVTTQLADNMKYVSIAKYVNNLNNALQNEMFISIPEGNFIVSPITRLLLAGKKIKGSGKRTILQFTGDVTCFDMDSIQDCFVEDLTVKVDATNTKDVFKISGSTATGESLKNRIKNIWIDTIDGTQGQYTGVRLLSSTAGVHQNEVINPTIENCKDGILLETTGNGAWTTHNLIENPYIKKFIGTAIGFIEKAGTTVINNILANPRIVDWTQENIERTGVRLTGMSNTITNIEIFNDGQYGTFYAFDLTETTNENRSYNNSIIGGGVEGLIKGEENINNHIIDINIVKRKNSLDTNPSSDAIRHSKTQVSNLIKNYNFMNGFVPWVEQNLTAAISASTNKEYYSKKLVLTKTVATSSKFYLNLPKPDLFVGKYITFTVAVKSAFKAFVLIDEGTPGFLRGSYHTGNGNTEILSVSKKIVGGGVIQVAIAFDDSVAIGSTIELEWTCANYGRMSPNVPLPAQPNYVDKNKGTATIPSGATSVIVQHGLEVTPNPQDISVTPTNDLGAASKFWIQYVSANQFYIYVNVDPGVNTATFVWKAEL